jgi:uncharacterized membrane protein
VRWVLFGAAGLWVAGVALVALSVVEGGASVALIAIVPVITGSSVAFLLGVVLIVAGFFVLPFALWERADEEPSALPAGGSAPPPTGGGGGVGGVVLVGPVPIVFGSWKRISRRTRWWLALAGAVVLTVVIVAFVWLLR